MTLKTAAESPGVSKSTVPGEVGIWVFIFFELTMFVGAFCAYLYDRGGNPLLFAQSQRTLSQAFGVANTFLLLTSSLLVVAAVRAISAETRAGRMLAPRLLAGAVGCGACFAALKLAEYWSLTGRHLGPGANHFFLWFFILTGLHFGHLALGTAGLLIVRGIVVRANRRRWARPNERMFVEIGATYWHMVDAVWVVLFPLVYLVH